MLGVIPIIVLPAAMWGFLTTPWPIDDQTALNVGQRVIHDSLLRLDPSFEPYIATLTCRKADDLAPGEWMADCTVDSGCEQPIRLHAYKTCSKDGSCEINDLGFTGYDVAAQCPQMISDPEILAYYSQPYP